MTPLAPDAATPDFESRLFEAGDMLPAATVQQLANHAIDAAPRSDPGTAIFGLLDAAAAIIAAAAPDPDELAAILNDAAGALGLFVQGHRDEMDENEDEDDPEDEDDENEDDDPYDPTHTPDE